MMSFRRGSDGSTIVNPNEQQDAKDFDGSLDRQLWDAFDFVRLNMKVPERKEFGRVDYPQYMNHSLMPSFTVITPFGAGASACTCSQTVWNCIHRARYPIP